MRREGGAQNIFFKLFRFEAKRYFANIALLVIACIVPIVLIMTILGSLLPVLFGGAELNDINVALYNEDETFGTNMIVKHLAESESVEDFVDLVEVSSLSDAKEMLIDGEASAIIHIPKNLQANLYQGKSQTIYFYSGQSDKQIVILLYDMLKGGLNNINQAQKSVDIVYYAMQDMGYERQEAALEYSSMAESLFLNIISRSDIFKDYNEVSATGDYLNIEYYLISTLLLCLFFLGLPICAKMSKDKFSGVLDRGGFYLNSFSYTFSKVLAGSMFLLLPALLTSVFILIVSGSFGLFSGNILLLFITVVLSSVYFAAIMLFIGTYARSTTSAIWIGFSIALAISMISGIFIPRNLMPRGVVDVAEILGLPSLIRLFGASLFGVKNSNATIDILKTLAICTIAFIASYLKTRKRLAR